jgi:hypothetical protein
MSIVTINPKIAGKLPVIPATYTVYSFYFSRILTGLKLIVFLTVGNEKYRLILLLIFCCHAGFSQINDDFSDGNFSVNPEWNGSNSGGDFKIINNRLRSESNKASGNFYLSTANTLASNCYWEFWINLQFSTSV